jgi:hypothetical protein
VGVVKHTPGPWEAKTNNQSEVFSWIVYNKEYSNWPIAVEMKEEDAKLAASAPELLEALKKALLFITNGRELGYIQMPDVESGDPALETPNIIRRAIVKAEGK